VLASACLSQPQLVRASGRPGQPTYDLVRECLKRFMACKRPGVRVPLVPQEAPGRPLVRGLMGSLSRSPDRRLTAGWSGCSGHSPARTGRRWQAQQRDPRRLLNGPDGPGARQPERATACGRSEAAPAREPGSRVWPAQWPDGVPVPGGGTPRCCGWRRSPGCPWWAVTSRWRPACQRRTPRAPGGLSTMNPDVRFAVSAP
jgi:hypothetical protein